jgi:AraC family transcriptional regulator, alkane utilization regulator
MVLGSGDSGSPTRLACGHLAFDEEFRHPFLDQLSQTIVIRAEEGAATPSFKDAFQLVAREARSGRPGGDAVVTRLSEIRFVQAVRHWYERSGPDIGSVAAMKDSGFMPALVRSSLRP